MREGGKFSKQLIVGIGVLWVIFILDLLTPLGVAVGALYVVAVYLILKESKRTLAIFSAVAIFLLLAKVGIYYREPFTWVIAVNRLISILAIVIMASVAIKRKNIFNKRNQEREEYIGFMEELLAATSHKVRAPVASCVGLIELITRDKEIEMTREETKQYFNYLKKNAVELETCTRDLTASIHKMKQEKERKNSLFGD